MNIVQCPHLPTYALLWTLHWPISTVRRVAVDGKTSIVHEMIIGIVSRIDLLNYIRNNGEQAWNGWSIHIVMFICAPHS